MSMTVSECEAFVTNMSDLSDRVIASNPEAEEFCSGVMTMAQSMLDGSIKRGKVSEEIQKSLYRMHGGMERWLR